MVPVAVQNATDSTDSLRLPATGKGGVLGVVRLYLPQFHRLPRSDTAVGLLVAQVGACLQHRSRALIDFKIHQHSRSLTVRADHRIAKYRAGNNLLTGHSQVQFCIHHREVILRDRRQLGVEKDGNIENTVNGLHALDS